MEKEFVVNLRFHKKSCWDEIKK